MGMKQPEMPPLYHSNEFVELVKHMSEAPDGQSMDPKSDGFVRFTLVEAGPVLESGYDL